MLEIVNIKKTYQMRNHEVQALKKVSFKADSGTLVAIVGPSGCGKTSLMNIMGALDSDFEGDVIINGKSLRAAKDQDLDSYRNNTVGFIFQNFALINSLTALQNVELAFDISNTSRSYKKKRAKELLRLVGLESHMKKRVNRLSGGQKQRVAIARALANDPDIILADELTGALDHETGMQIMKIMQRIARHKTVVMVTHSPGLARTFANLIVTMEDGDIKSIVENQPRNNEQVREKAKEAKESRMSFFKAFQLSYRNLKIKKGRTIGTAIGMSIGIVGIALALALTNGTKKSVENQMLSIFPVNTINISNVSENDEVKPLNYQQFQKALKVAKNYDAYTFKPDTIILGLASLDQNGADMKKYQENQLSQKKSTTRISELMGMFYPQKAYVGKISMGRRVNEQNPEEVVISRSTAEQLVKEGVNIKQVLNKKLYVGIVNFLKNEFKIAPYTIVGITSDNTMYGTGYVSQDSTYYMLKKYFNMSPEDVESQYAAIYLNDTKKIEKYVKNLNSKQKEFKFEGMANSIMELVEGIMSIVRNGLIAFSSISVFVAILMIALVIYISVLERTQEIGIIRALGGRKRDIRNIFVSEAIMIGLLAGIIGVGVAYLACFGINYGIRYALSQQTSNVPMFNVADLDFPTALILIGVCVLLSVISGLVPSLKAARLDPVQAIKKK